MGMDVFMEFTVRKLFKKDGRVIGCFSYSRNDGSFHVFKAKSIILATGGATRCWEVCSGSWEYTGEGFAIATGPVLKWGTWSLFSSIPQE